MSRPDGAQPANAFGLAKAWGVTYTPCSESIMPLASMAVSADLVWMVENRVRKSRLIDFHDAWMLLASTLFHVLRAALSAASSKVASRF